MKHSFEALTSEGKHSAIPEEFDSFGNLIGSWKKDYVDTSNFRVRPRAYHLSQ